MQLKPLSLVEMLCYEWLIRDSLLVFLSMMRFRPLLVLLLVILVIIHGGLLPLIWFLSNNALPRCCRHSNLKMIEWKKQDKNQKQRRRPKQWRWRHVSLFTYVHALIPPPFSSLSIFPSPWRLTLAPPKWHKQQRRRGHKSKMRAEREEGGWRRWKGSEGSGGGRKGKESEIGGIEEPGIERG